jgi:LmbE family N-acetylglucosaminyl deacetylase
MKKRILVVAAHPDDELLGAGGTLRKQVEAGNDVFCFILGEGAASRDGVSSDAVEKLQGDARRAGDIIGFRDVQFVRFPDNAFDTVGLLRLTKEVERVIAAVKPQSIYTHHEYDLNIDHRLTFQAVLTAARPCNTDRPDALYTFETLSSTEWQSKDHKQFAPNTYVNIEGTLEKKIAAMRAYASEIREYPHPRSAEGIRIVAAFRGLESGCAFAEAFRLVRLIE